MEGHLDNNNPHLYHSFGPINYSCHHKISTNSCIICLSVIALELCITKGENHLLSWYMRMSVLHSDLSKYAK